MLRRCMCLLAALWLIHGAAVPAEAQDASGTIRIKPGCCGQSVSGGTVAICWLGEETEGGFLLTDGLANWRVSSQEVFSEAFLDALVKRGPVGLSRRVTGTEGVCFPAIKPGLYLVTQPEAAPGYLHFSPFLLNLQENGAVEAAPQLVRDGESPHTGDHPAPIIGAMGVGFCVAVLMVLADQRKK